MNSKIQSHLEPKIIGQQKLLPGEIFKMQNGADMYVVPLQKLGKMKIKDLNKVKKEIEARRLVQEADKLLMERINAGWTEEDFKKDFLRVVERIAKFLSNKQKHAKNKTKQIKI